MGLFQFLSSNGLFRGHGIARRHRIVSLGKEFEAGEGDLGTLWGPSKIRRPRARALHSDAPCTIPQGPTAVLLWRGLQAPGANQKAPIPINFSAFPKRLKVS